MRDEKIDGHCPVSGIIIGYETVCGTPCDTTKSKKTSNRFGSGGSSTIVIHCSQGQGAKSKGVPRRRLELMTADESDSFFLMSHAMGRMVSL